MSEEQIDGHEAQSNEPEEPSEAAVPEGEEISEEPSEGEGFEGGQEESLEGTEDVAGYEELSAPLGQVLADPTVALTAPDTTGLRDIAEASFGPPVEGGMSSIEGPAVEGRPAVPTPPPLRPEVVIGTDDRIQITNTSAYPWRVHASLRITARDGSLWIGTGWFIGPHTLATAGHVVFIYAPGTARHGWVRSIQVMPGRNGSSLPYGSVTSSSFRSVTGWTQSGSENFDYGAIIIPTELGRTVGWFGFGVYSDSDLRTSTANIAGYPGDKPSGTQWYHARKVASVNSRKVYYAIDTAGGQSGSAVYRLKAGGRYGIAIHAYGGAAANSGTRIVRPVFDNLRAWKA
jgi:V8-like Glu-specific endopeptidase